MPLIDKDRLYSLPRDKAAEVAHGALFPIQERPNFEQIAGLAVLFAAFCNRLQLDPQEMHSIGMRMLRDEPFHHKGNAQIDSLRDFAGIVLTEKHRPQPKE